MYPPLIENLSSVSDSDLGTLGADIDRLNVTLVELHRKGIKTVMQPFTSNVGVRQLGVTLMDESKWITGRTTS